MVTRVSSWLKCRRGKHCTLVEAPFQQLHDRHTRTGDSAVPSFISKAPALGRRTWCHIGALLFRPDATAVEFVALSAAEVIPNSPV
ncbi:hypothetical protein Mapa_000376 [Marchantia paleacea]|nr:hypothetical protein Mapa_000376 [Marchantia paleacea]